MQEQINEKTVALSIKGAKLTGRMLAKAMQAFLKKMREPPKGKPGKVSMRSLRRDGASLTNIEVDDPGIKRFNKIARKHNVRFHTKIDRSKEPPLGVVFFKAKDGKAMDSAFKEYTALEIKHEKTRKPSMLAKLAKFKELAKLLASPVKNRNRGERDI
jgi:hypothetical protein